jgi:hypothetical protein
VSVLTSLDWRAVRDQYDIREQTHTELLSLYRARSVADFVQLLLGISKSSGNYSASEHGIGPKIIAENRNVDQRLCAVVEEFLGVKNAHEVPPIIRSAKLRYFQIGSAPRLPAW